MRSSRITRGSGSFTLEMRDEPTHSLPSSEVRYAHEHVMNKHGEASSRHGVISRSGDTIVASCLLAAGGGASGVHEHSLVIDGERCFVAVGDCAVALHIPTLDVVWVQQVDPATCFGLHLLPGGDGLLSHGELEISRLTFGGEIVWSASGRDIFTGELSVRGDQVHVVDFNGDEYDFDRESGALRRGPPVRG